MRNCLWTKGFGIGIIILFLGASVLPSITANIVNVDTPDDNINNSTVQYPMKYSIIGLIKWLEYPSNNSISFRCIIVYYWSYVDGQLDKHGFLSGSYPAYIFYDTKTGIIIQPIIFATFTLNWDYCSQKVHFP